MKIADDDIRRIERLCVRAWPAFETADIHGWLWRLSGGGSQRANSVSTVDFAGGDPATALDAVEARYRARNAPVWIHTYDLSATGRYCGSAAGARLRRRRVNADHGEGGGRLQSP